jgi:hypothetical protein
MNEAECLATNFGTVHLRAFIHHHKSLRFSSIRPCEVHGLEQ